MQHMDPSVKQAKDDTTFKNIYNNGNKLTSVKINLRCYELKITTL